ncbi:MAG: hypothetical protein ABI642_16735 [Polaromonas sp.]
MKVQAGGAAPKPQLGMRSKIPFMRHTREEPALDLIGRGYPDPFERFSLWRWIPAYAGMTDGKSLLSASLFA